MDFRVKRILLFTFLSAGTIIFDSCNNDTVVGTNPVSLSPQTSTFGADFAYDWASVTYHIVSDQQPNPPKASRIYSYLGVAMYEAVAPGIPHSRSLSGQLRDMPQMPSISSDSVYDWPSV